MDIRRTLLIISLLVVGYLLIVAWNEDYGSKPQEYAETKLSQSVDLPQAQLDAADSHKGTDVPVVSDAAVPEPTKISPANFIQVTTDVFDLRINPEGGDLVALDLLQYSVSKDNPDQPFQLLETNERRLYQAQSGLVGRDGWDKSNDRPVYSATQNHYVLADGKDVLVVELTAQRDAVELVKRYRFERGSYLVQLEYDVVNKSSEALSVNLYAQLKRDSSQDPSQMGGLGMQSYLGAALTTPEDKYKKFDFDDMDEASFKETFQGGWVSFLQHYFLAAWVPSQDQDHTYRIAKSGRSYLMGYYDSAVSIAPNSTKTLSTQLYVGPKDQDRLVEVHPDLDLTVDYGWLFWIAKPLFWILQLIHSWLGNWGWAIIVLTVLIKAAFYPLSKKSYTSMARMRKVAPKLQALKERYGEDRQQLSMKMMELYRKEKINPLSGCLPMLVQMPVFIALYWMLMESVELRQAPWLLWITDLSVQDPWFILPSLMGVSMFIQMLLQPTPPDPVQANVMKIMPMMFTVFFFFFPAGLVLYWLVNNILSIAQQWWINKNIEQEDAPTKAVAR